MLGLLTAQKPFKQRKSSYWSRTPISFSWYLQALLLPTVKVGSRAFIDVDSNVRLLKITKDRDGAYFLSLILEEPVSLKG